LDGREIRMIEQHNELIVDDDKTRKQKPAGVCGREVRNVVWRRAVSEKISGVYHGYPGSSNCFFFLCCCSKDVVQSSHSCRNPVHGSVVNVSINAIDSQYWSWCTCANDNETDNPFLRLMKFKHVGIFVIGQNGWRPRLPVCYVRECTMRRSNEPSGAYERVGVW